MRVANGGYYGKMPSRGDFVRGGLEAPVVDALDGWMRACVAASMEVLGDGWFACWMEAPVWHFASMIEAQWFGGVWMPSMDKAERCFPLMILTEATRAGAAWRAAAEAVCFDAVTGEIAPDRLALLVAGLPADPCVLESGWWTVGAPRKAAVRVGGEALPEPAGFASFLTDAAA